MGTRGIIGFVVDGEEKINYQQFDSYPSGTGVEVLTWLRGITDLPAIKEKVRAVEVVDPDSKPTQAQIDQLKGYADDSVSTGHLDEWYVLLRNTQGAPDRMIECGVIANHSSFALDSLFCEWGYIVDFDRDVFEIYRGFQTQPHTDGRFASRPPTPAGRDRHTGKYFPIRLVESYSLSALPTNEEFLALDTEDE